MTASGRNSYDSCDRLQQTPAILSAGETSIEIGWMGGCTKTK